MLSAMRLPVRHSTVERPMQESAGIFQFGTAQLMSSVEALTLAGAIASATGAPLGDPEFDVHTWLRERFVALGCPDDNAVPFTGHALQRALYGYKSGQTRKLLMRALDNLTRAVVTIPGFDAQRGVLDPDAVSRRLRLLEGVVEHGFYERFVAARARGEAPNPGDFASLGSQRGDITLVALLPSWSARAVRAGLGAPLNLDAQRELGGVAKRLWVQLDAQPFVGDGGEREVFVLKLDPTAYAAIGFHHRRATDRRRYLAAALARICAADPSYMADQTRVEVHPTRKGLHLLTVTRCTGNSRQQRLRERHLRRARADQQRHPQQEEALLM
jgi:hypothetical protein